MEQGSCSSSRKAVAVDCRRAMLLERSYKTFRIRLARSFFPVHRELCRAIHRICPATMRGRYEAPIYTYWERWLGELLCQWGKPRRAAPADIPPIVGPT